MSGKLNIRSWSIFVCLNMMLFQKRISASQADMENLAQAFRDSFRNNSLTIDSVTIFSLLIGAILGMGFAAVYYMNKKQKKILEKSKVENVKEKQVMPNNFSYRHQHQEKRSWFRLPIRKEICYARYNKTTLPEDEEFLEVPLLNISGDGLAFISGKRIAVGESIKMRIGLEETKVLILTGKVLRTVPYGHPDYPYQIAVRYLDINERDRDKVVKFLTKYQTEHMGEFKN